MTNRYRGTCTNCRRTVEPGAGTATRTASGWAIQHTDCAAVRDSDGGMAPGWSAASIRRSGGSVYAATHGTRGRCQDCGSSASLVRGLCDSCRDYE